MWIRELMNTDEWFYQLSHICDRLVANRSQQHHTEEGNSCSRCSWNVSSCK